MQQRYQCPRCGTQVAFGTSFCGSCEAQLNWSTQQQEPPYYQQQPSRYQQQRYGYSGQQIKKKRINTWLIVLGSVFAFIVLISVIVGISGGGEPSSLPNGTEITPITVNAEQLCQAYDANQVAADALYKNKILKVSGVVDDIGRDWLGYAEVELRGAEYSTRRYTVQCTFSTQNEYLVTQLSKGQSVIIQGTCDGREMFLYAVSLKNCTIVK
jgi:hypothetical protein